MGYGIGFYVLQFLFVRLGFFRIAPNNENIIAWDAAWYQDIVRNGSVYWEGMNSNAGFFVLFPFFWKIFGVSGLSVCLMNIVFFSVAFGLYNSMYDLKLRTRLLWLSIPSFYYAFVPYSEALFLLLTTATIFGIHHKRNVLVWISLFLLSLCRPVTMVIGPALLITELVCNNRSQWGTSVKRFLWLHATPLLSGLAVFIVYQYYATGVWFAYFKLQSTVWGHKFALPTLPFGSMYGLELLWLDAIVLFIGFVSTILVVKYAVRWGRQNTGPKDYILVLSCLYFVGISLVTILFNPLWGINATNIFDIHRYGLISAFFWVFMHRFTVDRVYALKDYLTIIVLSNFLWLTFYHFKSWETFAYYNIAGLVIVLYMLTGSKKNFWVIPVIILMNIVLQQHLLQKFISNVYLG